MRNGFTLLELLLVIAIVGILGTASTSYTARFYTQNAVSNTADELASMLRTAQLYSMMGKQSGGVWGVKYTTSPKRITLFLQGSSSFDEKYDVNNSVSIIGFSQITFAHLTGLPSSSAPMTISGNGQSEGITMNSQGVISKN